MAKLVGFPSLFLVILAMLVVGTAAQDLPRKVCSRPSQDETLQKSCGENPQTCRNACLTEKKSDPRIVDGMCETLWSFNQAGFNACVNNASGGRSTSCFTPDDIGASIDFELVGCVIDPFLKEECQSKNMINNGKRCICLYDCPNP